MLHLSVLWCCTHVDCMIRGRMLGMLCLFWDIQLPVQTCGCSFSEQPFLFYCSVSFLYSRKGCSSLPSFPSVTVSDSVYNIYHSLHSSKPTFHVRKITRSPGLSSAGPSHAFLPRCMHCYDISDVIFFHDLKGLLQLSPGHLWGEAVPFPCPLSFFHFCCGCLHVKKISCDTKYVVTPVRSLTSRTLAAQNPSPQGATT